MDASIDPDFESVLAANARKLADQVQKQIATLLGHLPTKGPRDKKPPAFMRGLLLEIAAVARLQAWEDAGFLELIGYSLPTSEEALHDLRQRFANNPELAFTSNGALLCRVLMVWRVRFALCSGDDIGADCLLCPPDNSELVEALAQFLFRHRGLTTSTAGN